MSTNKTVCMLGEGAWGTAVATLLAHNRQTVNLWCHHADVAQEIKEKQTNARYLPGVRLSKNIVPTTDIDAALCGTRWVFEAIPIKYLRAVLKKTVSCFTDEQIWVVLSKGIEKDTLLLPTQILDDVFTRTVNKAVFAGPSFAKQVADKQITAVTIASTDCDVAASLQNLLANEYFRPYGSLDVVGVQLAAALKNVITFGVGLLDGAGYNDNTKAFFMTRGLHETSQLIQAMGGAQKTAYGLSGVGDLVLTSMGALSRNLEVGRRLGAGESLDAIIQKTGYTPEGVNTVASVQKLAERVGCKTPVCRGVYEVIFGGKSVTTMLQDMMQQPLEWECDV